MYTWVNGSDPKLQEAIEYWKPRFLEENNNFKEYKKTKKEEKDATTSTVVSVCGSSNATSSSTKKCGNATLEAYKPEEDSGPTHGGANRYRDNHELMYSMRSIWENAPWVSKRGSFRGHFGMNTRIYVGHHPRRHSIQLTPSSNQN